MKRLIPLFLLIAAGLVVLPAAHAAGVKADAVNELTGGAGVTVDGVAIKDGAVTTGTWNGDAVPVTNGGTGADNATDARANLNVALPATGAAHVVVQVTDNPATNGDNLRAAYAAAAALTPHGGPLSATNRAVVLVPPGNYDLGASNLTLDTEFVDLVGVSTAREDQYIYRAGTVLGQTAADVRIENLVFHYTSTTTGVYTYHPNVLWNDGAAHNGSPPQTAIRNCEFRVSASQCAGMRTRVEYAGTYQDCLTGNYGFGALGSGNASGTFIRCEGGDYAFGGNGGTASGTFTDCTGGDYAFGGGYGSTASGTFTGCTGGDFAFGGAAFGIGSDSTASGTFTGCTGGDLSFGGGTYVASGTFTGCIGGNYAFGGIGSASGGVFRHCTGGSYAFAESGSPAPVHLFCIKNNAQYTGNE